MKGPQGFRPVDFVNTPPRGNVELGNLTEAVPTEPRVYEPGLQPHRHARENRDWLHLYAENRRL